MQVIGVDGYSKGWVAVLLENGDFVRLSLHRSLAEALANSDAEVIGIDIPIGLPEKPPRPADIEAAAFLTGQAGVVFPTFPRKVYEQSSHAEAADYCRRRGWGAVSQQSFGLGRRILEVETVRDDRVFEVHPEVSFREIAGRAIGFSKHTWTGFMARRSLLTGKGIEFPDNLANAPLIDTLDAGAAAWTATRYARGKALPFPTAGARGDDGVIWR